jgi:cobalt/nickel transport system ATP-binding protein
MSSQQLQAGVAGDPHSPIHRLDPRAKLIGLTGVTLVAVSTPLHAWPAWIACALALATVALIGHVSAKTLWSRARVVLPLVLFVAIFVPFVRRGGETIALGPLTVSEAGLATFATVAAKSILGTLSAVLLGATTSFPDVLHALERLKAPRLLVLIAAFMYRYLFVIVDEVRRARRDRPLPADLRARRARPPRNVGARLEPDDAAPRRPRLPPRRRALPVRPGDPAPRSKDAGMSCAIHARDLRFTYPNGVTGLDGLDLHVTHGERVAVLGPNGAGKTTLMLHLNALLTGKGELEVAGLRVGHDDVRDLRARVGLIFQDPDDQLFMPTVREDVAFGPLNLGLSKPEVEDRIAHALDAVRVSDLADRAPHQLSLGQRRRVAIATVLAMHPSLLVLDEPSANLDPRTRRELIETLDQIDRTLLIVTHDLPLAASLCERSVLLSAGKIVADGSTHELLRDEQLLAAHDLELPEGFDLNLLATR